MKDSNTFSNQDSYEFYKSHIKKDNTHTQDDNTNNERLSQFKQKLQNGIPLDDLLTNYNRHRLKTQQINKSEIKGWEKQIYKHEPKHDPLNPFYLNKSYNDKYNMYNEESVTGARYWSSKETDDYYSLNKYERLKLYLKTILDINYDLVLFNIIVLLVLAYYAKKKSEQLI